MTLLSNTAFHRLFNTTTSFIEVVKPLNTDVGGSQKDDSEICQLVDDIQTEEGKYQDTELDKFLQQGLLPGTDTVDPYKKGDEKLSHEGASMIGIKDSLWYNETSVPITTNQDFHGEKIEKKKVDNEVGNNDDIVDKMELANDALKTTNSQTRYKAKAFMCKCGETFKTERGLKSHKEKKPYRYKCDSCCKSFIYKTAYEQHLITHTRPLKCSERPRRRARNRGVKNRLLHSKNKKIYKCCECFKTSFKSQHKFDHHMSTKHNKSFQCTICSRSFMYESSFESHVVKCGNHDLEIVCECGKKFKTKEHLKRHQETDSHCYICEYCGKEFMNRGIYTDHLLCHIKRYKCSLCLKQFKRPSALRKHQYVHTGKKECVCDLCGKELVDMNSVRIHKICVHSDERPYKCHMCPYSCKLKQELASHIRSHNNERRYKCKYCTKAFVESSTLKQHERIHTGEKPYRCQFCDQAFNQRNGLRSHMATNHGVKPPKTKSSSEGP